MALVDSSPSCRHAEGTRASVPPPVSSLGQSDYSAPRCLSTLTWAKYLTLRDWKTLHTRTLPSCIRHGFIYEGNSCCCCTSCSCTTQQLTVDVLCVYYALYCLPPPTRLFCLFVGFPCNFAGPVSNEPKKMLFNFRLDPSDS